MNPTLVKKGMSPAQYRAHFSQPETVQTWGGDPGKAGFFILQKKCEYMQLQFAIIRVAVTL